MVANVLFGLIVCGIIIAVLVTRNKENQAWMAEHLALAEEAFGKIRIHSHHSHLILDGAKAKVIDDKPEVISNGRHLLGYALNRIVKNASGEYFWLRFDSVNEPKVIVKHMEHAVAKALLKEKYIAP